MVTQNIQEGKTDRVRTLVDVKQKARLLSKDMDNLLDVLASADFEKGVNKLLFLLKFRKPDDSARIRKAFPNFATEFITIDELLGNQQKMRELIYSSYSLTKSKFFYEILGYAPSVIFSYSLEGLTQTQKTRFVYTLHGRKNGRDKIGTVARLGGTKLSNGVVIIPVKNSVKFQKMLEEFGVHAQETGALTELAAKEFHKEKGVLNE